MFIPPVNREVLIKKFILLLFLFIVSCNYSTREEGFVYFRLDSNPTTLDPAYVVDVTGGFLAAKLFNGLVKIDKNLNVVPDIASLWDISPDGKVYTFYLRKDVRFSNGRIVQASDFVYSFTRVLDPAHHCPNTWVLDKIKGAADFIKGKSKNIEGLKLLDDYSLQITLEQPFSPFLSLLTMITAYVVPEEEVLRHGDSFGFHPVGTGPFTLHRWTPNVELVLSSWRNYFEGGPKVKGLVYRIIPEDLTAITEFDLGNIDVITLPPSAYRYYTTNPLWRGQILSQVGLYTYYIGFNCEKAPFENRNVRRAIGFALDAKKILDTLYEGRGRQAFGPVPEILRQWDIFSPYYYDPKIARALIKESGIQSPVRVDFYITSDQNIVDIAEVIQSYLNDVGFSVNIKQLEWSSYKEALNNGEADMFYLSWWADYPDPENFLYPLFHSSNIGAAGNRTRYANHEVDQLIEKGQLSVNSNMRNRFYRKAEQKIIDDAPWIPLWHRNDYILVQKWIEGFRVFPIYSSDKGTDIFFSKPARAND